MPIPVCYATNRPWTSDGYGTAAGPGASDATFATLRFGTVEIDASADPGFAGTIAAPRQEAGTCAATAPSATFIAFLRSFLTRAKAAGSIPLLYVHGFNFTFADAVVRTGDLAAFYGEAPGAPAIAPLLFTWPSLGDLSQTSYLTDRDSARRSGEALAGVLAALGQADVGVPLILMAHSMGAWALDNGVQALLRRVPAPAKLFAQAIVAAGDDDDTAFNAGGGLLPLQDLASWVTIGIDRSDVIVSYDAAEVLHRARLAKNGPSDPTASGPNVYVVDYTAAATEHRESLPDGTDWNDFTHNYYRTVPLVRDDLVQIIANVAPRDVVGRIVAPNGPPGPAGARWAFVMPQPGTLVASLNNPPVA